MPCVSGVGMLLVPKMQDIEDILTTKAKQLYFNATMCVLHATAASLDIMNTVKQSIKSS